MSDRWRQYVRVTPFGTVQAATFSFPQPLGSLIPTTPGVTLLRSLDPRALDITGSIGDPRANPLAEPTPLIQFPAINRTLKGDLLVPRERPLPVEPSIDKPKKVPGKTQERAQFEQPKPTERPRIEFLHCRRRSSSRQSRKPPRYRRAWDSLIRARVGFARAGDAVRHGS